MKGRLTVLIVGVIVGVTATITIGGLAARRASYYWAAEASAGMAADFERASKALATQGKYGEARNQLAAAVLIRQSLAGKTPEALAWPFGTPVSALLDLAQSPSLPLLKTQDIYGDRSTSFMLNCAIAQVSARADNREPQQVDWDRVAAGFPGSTASNCAKLGKSFWD